MSPLLEIFLSGTIALQIGCFSIDRNIKFAISADSELVLPLFSVLERILFNLSLLVYVDKTKPVPLRFVFHHRIEKWCNSPWLLVLCS